MRTMPVTFTNGHRLDTANKDTPEVALPGAAPLGARLLLDGEAAGEGVVGLAAHDGLRHAISGRVAAGACLWARREKGLGHHACRRRPRNSMSVPCANLVSGTQARHWGRSRSRMPSTVLQCDQASRQYGALQVWLISAIIR